MAANGREIAPSAILQSFCTQTITTENGSRAAKSKNPSVRTHARDKEKPVFKESVSVF